MSRPVPVAGQGGLQLSAMPKQPLAELLLANLRLLDLDIREDWPEITSKTFSTKDTQQNQKQRIKCTEWVLFRLFELWDPEETRDKLQPFFPPLEPLQSLNLRGALFRSLNELKKNGALGRESVLRKTMLDECKGEKLMELLVIFSTAVLKKKATTRESYIPSISYRVASSPMLNPIQQGSLIPLTIAHAASITNMLKRREERRQRYGQFNDLLDGKRAQLRQRVKISVQSKRRESNVNEEAHVKQVVHDNWTGHGKWAQALLTGDDVNAGDVPLQKPFQEVWPSVSDGDHLVGDPSVLGLLATLDRRVQTQKERLQMWEEFHENLRVHEDGHIRAVQHGATTAANLKFDRHQQLQLLPGRTTNEPVNKPTSDSNAYDGIVAGLSNDITNASKSRRNGGAGWTSLRDGDSSYLSHDLFSPVKSSAAFVPGEGRPAEKARRRIDIIQDRPSLHAPTERTRLNGFKVQRLGSDESKATEKLITKQAPISITTPEMVKHVPIRETQSEVETPIKIAQESPIVEKTAADLIISAVVNATPSPVKPMSLTERTRMSMAYFNGTAREPDGVDSGIAMPSVEPEPEKEPEKNEDEDATQTKDLNRRASLLERTRLSMAQVPSQSMNSKKALKRQSRQSLFPVNQFETPGKPRAPPEPDRGATPTDKLFSDEAEYASVFKSRPRIALSPVWSPDGPPSFTGLDESLDLDLGLDDDLDEGGNTGLSGFESSPLAARRKIITGNNG